MQENLATVQNTVTIGIFRMQCAGIALLISSKPEVLTGSSTRPEKCLRHPIDQADNNENLVAEQPGDSKTS